MFKKKLIIVLITFIFYAPVYSAGTSSDFDKSAREDLSHMKVKNSNFKKGNDALKQAQKYKKKGKEIKAKKRFNDALNFFLLANKEIPNNPGILNYLGFTSRKLGDFAMAEIYYELGLEIDPEHNGINEYLGELYIETNRIDKAKERLKVLENCKCDESKELKAAIKQGSSKF